MKKLFKVLGIAAALATVLGFGMIGCSDDSYDEAVVAENLNPSTDALWALKNIPYRNFPSNEADVSGTIAADGNIKGDGPVKGATLSIGGKGYYKGYSDEEAKTEATTNILFGRIQAKKNTATLADFTKAGMTLELHLAAKSSTVTIKASVAGSTDLPMRFITVAKKADNPVAIPAFSADGTTLAVSSALSKATTLMADLAAGDYVIYLNGANIFYISAKSESFESETVTYINAAGTSTAEQKYLGIVGETIVTNSDASVVAVSIAEKKINNVDTEVVTVKSKKAGKSHVVIAGPSALSTPNANSVAFENVEFDAMVEPDGKVTIENFVKNDFIKRTYNLNDIAVTADSSKVTKPFWIDADSKYVWALKQEDAEGTDASKKSDNPTVLVIGDLCKAFEGKKDENAASTRLGLIKTITANIDCLTSNGTSTITAETMGTGTIKIKDSSNEQAITVTVAGDGTMSFAAGALPFVKSKQATVTYAQLALGTTIADVASVTGSYGYNSYVTVNHKADDGEIEFTAKKHGTATITVKGTFNVPGGSETVASSALITVTVADDGEIDASVDAHCAYPYFFEKNKVNLLYSLQNNLAKLKADIPGTEIMGVGSDGTADETGTYPEKVTALGLGEDGETTYFKFISDGGGNAFGNITINLDQDDVSGDPLVTKIAGTELKFNAKFNTKGDSKAKRAMKITIPAGGAYVSIIAAGTGADTARFVAIDPGESFALTGTTAKLMIPNTKAKILVAKLDAGEYYVGTKKNTDIYALNIYTDK